jgi:hypothetical protein
MKRSTTARLTVPGRSNACRGHARPPASCEFVFGEGAELAGQYIGVSWTWSHCRSQWVGFLFKLEARDQVRCGL